MKKFPNPVDTFMSGCPKIFFSEYTSFQNKGQAKSCLEVNILHAISPYNCDIYSFEL